MALITRLTRLFRADMHEVLDRLEAPDVLLRQAIREMEESLELSTRLVRAREQERDHIERRITDITATLSRLETELDLCFQAENTALVRLLLRRKLEAEKLSQQLAQASSQLNSAIEKNNMRISEQHQRLEAMKLKAAAFETTASVSDCSDHAYKSECIVTEADIDLALLREQNKRRSS